MKVFITTNAHFPLGLAETSRIRNYAKMLIKAGIECIVLTTSGKGGADPSCQIPYLRLGIDYIGKGKITLLRAYFVNNIKMHRYVRKHAQKGDIVLAYGVLDPFTTLLHCCFPKWLPVIRETNEIPHYRQRLDRNIQRWIELHLLFKFFYGFIVISDELEKVVAKYKSNEAVVVKIPILTDVTEYSDIMPKENLLGPYIFHSGSHSENKDGFLGILKAIGLLKQKYSVEMHLYVTGSCGSNIEMENVLFQYNITHLVHFVGFLSIEELKQYQAGSFAFIINKYDSFQNKYCFATKTGEYLVSQKPIIMTSIGEAMNYFSNNINAIIVKPNDPALISDAIYELMNNKALYDAIVKNGFLLVNTKFDVSSQINTFVSFIKKVSDENSMDN